MSQSISAALAKVFVFLPAMVWGQAADAQTTTVPSSEPPASAQPSLPAEAAPTLSNEKGTAASVPGESTGKPEPLVDDSGATLTDREAAEQPVKRAGEPTANSLTANAADGAAGPSSDSAASHPSQVTPQITLTGPITCAESVSYSPNPGSKSSERIVLPSQDVEVGGEMVFITADERLDAFGQPRDEIRYTDVGLLRLRGRRSFNDWLELYAGTSLLAKQPADWDESIWQGAHGGARMVLTDGLAARIGGGGGPLFEERGNYFQLSPELQLKYNADHLLRFDLGLGSSTTIINARADAETFWLEELTSHSETQFGDHHGAFWVRLDYSVPLASSPTRAVPDERTGRSLDPQVRLSMQAGGVLTIRSGWDAFVSYTFVDRGELDRPETLLPLLDEGFDQNQIVFGVQHRFEVDTCKRRVCGRCED